MYSHCGANEIRSAVRRLAAFACSHCLTVCIVCSGGNLQTRLLAIRGDLGLARAWSQRSDSRRGCVSWNDHASAWHGGVFFGGRRDLSGAFFLPPFPPSLFPPLVGRTCPLPLFRP